MARDFFVLAFLYSRMFVYFWHEKFFGFIVLKFGVGYATADTL